MYIGIDYSSSNTGLCVLDFNKELVCFYLISPKDKNFDKRILQTYKELIEIVEGFKPVKIGIESPSFFSKGKVVDLAAGYGYIKYNLLRYGYEVFSFAPQQIKKFATNNGRATKDDMIKQLQKDVQLDISDFKKQDDLADAYWIAKML